MKQTIGAMQAVVLWNALLLCMLDGHTDVSASPEEGRRQESLRETDSPGLAETPEATDTAECLALKHKTTGDSCWLFPHQKNLNGQSVVAAYALLRGLGKVLK